MSLLELFILAVGLSMDAFAVSVCKGLSVPRAGIYECGTAGFYFGGFQALMPLLGFGLGTQFKAYITSMDHWIAFLLLGIIGINMIREAQNAEEACQVCSNGQNPFSFKSMLPLAIATSIDALAVGVTFAFLEVQILLAVTFIGVVTFLLSAAGIRIGNLFGSRWKVKAELAGGVILICMGIKILLEHLGIFSVI